MFEWGWVRFIVASVLLGGWGICEGLGSLLGSRRARSGSRPRWSHFIGFASLIVFYALIAKGGALWNGDGNTFGLLACGVAMALRLVARLLPVRHPAVWTRLGFFAALPVAVGTLPGWVGLTLPQVLIGLDEMRRADQLRAGVARA